MRAQVSLVGILVVVALFLAPRVRAASIEPDAMLAILSEALLIAQTPVDGLVMGSLPSEGVSVTYEGYTYHVVPSPSGDGTFVRPFGGPIDGVEEVFIDFSLTMMVIENVTQLDWLSVPASFHMVVTHPQGAPTSPSVSVLGFSRYGANPLDPTNLEIMVGAQDGNMIVRNLTVSFDPTQGPGVIQISEAGVTGPLFGPPPSEVQEPTDQPPAEIADANTPATTDTRAVNPAPWEDSASLGTPMPAASSALVLDPVVMTTLDYQANPQLSPRPDDVIGGNPSPSSL